MNAKVGRLGVTAMRVGPETYSAIMQRGDESIMPNVLHRSMLVSLKPGCYVETNDGSGGDVVKVERDELDIPVAVLAERKTKKRKNGKPLKKVAEWIDVDDITYWEAWDFRAPEYLFYDSNAIIGELMFLSEVK